jgi:hypothetical protein
LDIYGSRHGCIFGRMALKGLALLRTEVLPEKRSYVCAATWL